MSLFGGNKMEDRDGNLVTRGQRPQIGSACDGVLEFLAVELKSRIVRLIFFVDKFSLMC